MKVTTQALGACVPGPHGPRWLWRELGLQIDPGRVWMVVGPNGSGKTTLLRCLAGLRDPDEGRIALDDRELASIDGRQRARSVAYLPQATPLYHDLRVRDLVMLGRAPYLGRLRPPTVDDVQQVRTALQRVDIEALADRGIESLSGGERQRAMLARMLATRAPVLILDEPTTALDVGHALRLLELVRDLATSGHAIVMAMHDLELARRYGDDAVCLTQTEAFHLGPTSEVLRPEVLSDVFDVRVELVADALRFGLR